MMCVLSLVLSYLLVSYLASIPLARWLCKEDVSLAVSVVLLAPLILPVAVLAIGTLTAVAFLHERLEKVIEK